MYPSNISSVGSIWCFVRFLVRFSVVAEQNPDHIFNEISSVEGEECMINEFLNIFKDRGIVGRRTCSYTPQQNVIAERMNHTLLVRMRAMPKAKNVLQRNSEHMLL